MGNRNVVIVCVILAVITTITWNLAFESLAQGATYQVGPSRTYTTLQAVAGLLNPGDIVAVDGNHTYPGGVVFNRAGTAAAPIHIRGIRVNGQRPVISGGVNAVAFTTPWPYNLPDGGHHYVFEGFEITGATSRGIFHQARDLTVRDCLITHCRNGILGADQGSGSLLLEYTEIAHCGEGGSAHQVYMATDEVNNPGSVFRMQHCYIHSGNGGNNVKSRAERNEIYYNWIEGAFYHELELIGPDAAADGGNPHLIREDSDVVGNVLIKKLTAAGNNPNFYVIRIGGDGTGETHGRYRFLNNTIIAGSGDVFRMFDALESVEIQNNVLYNPSGVLAFHRTVEADWVTGEAVISGRNNWVQIGTLRIPTQLVGTISGAAPGFVDIEQEDLEPAAGSPLIDAGVLPTVPPAGFEFPNPLPAPLKLPPPGAIEAPGTASDRDLAGAIDIGAFEYLPPATLTVLAVAGNGGHVSPDSRTVPYGASADFTVTPDTGYTHGPVTGNCPAGTFSDNTYTTGAITADCAVGFNFASSQTIGSVRVTIEPEAARTANAQWRRVGTSAWRDSGTVESNIPFGTYPIEFKPVNGWEVPARPSLSIGPGPEVTFTGHYSLHAGNVVHVDDSNETTHQEGTAQYPYRVLQVAIDAAVSGDTIKVAVGSYGHATTSFKALSILGGYPGADAASYSAGTGGDFTQRVLNPVATVISGGTDNDGLTFTRNNDDPYHGVVDNLTVSQSRKGIVCDKATSWPHPENLTISNTIVENNGQAGETSSGAGVLVCGLNMRILNTIIRSNHGGRGAGISGSADGLLVEASQIENNVCYDDHGAGIYLYPSGPLTLRNNLIVGNRIELGYGWGGGVTIFNPGPTAVLSGNIIRNNYAPSYGAGVFIDEGASATMHNDLVIHNQTAEGIGGGVAVDDGDPGPSHLVMHNCTVAYNNAGFSGDEYWLGGNGVFVDNNSTVIITNSIFWGNGDDFFVHEGSSLSMTWSLSEEGWTGTGNLTSEPLFADVAAGDFHLRSTTGRYHAATGNWLIDTQHSPAIDAGDPASAFAHEPLPNGGRINLGAFGNTAQASKSAATPEPTGSLRVIITPPEAAAAGVQWRRTGTTSWFSSGDTEINVPVGTWTAEFKAAPGWAKPGNLTVTIADGQTTVETTESRPASTALPGVLLLLLE